MVKKATPKPKVRAKDSETLDSSDDVVDRICSTLATAIGEGALKPGIKILDEVIADHFGVSRTVVRGALDILQRDHLVERKRNHGVFVVEPTIREAKQLFEARHALEQTILGIVVERATDADFDYLDRFNEQDERIRHGLEERPADGPAKKFHLELAKLSDNDVLTEILDKVMARISLVMALYDGETRDPCGDHRNIIAAMRRRDLKSAQALMAEHLAVIEGRVSLTPTEGDHQSFVNLLKTFSSVR
jgi:DNA-binding GntR family transcriptional regulator